MPDTTSRFLVRDDYPTDSSLPAGLRDRKILVLDASHRLPLLFALQSDLSVELTLDERTSLALASIFAIERAAEGIDYPTDIPGVDFDFFVLVKADGERLRLD